jgi:hypothetical protein
MSPSTTTGHLGGIGPRWALRPPRPVRPPRCRPGRPNRPTLLGSSQPATSSPQAHRVVRLSGLCEGVFGRCWPPNWPGPAYPWPTGPETLSVCRLASSPAAWAASLPALFSASASSAAPEYRLTAPRTLPRDLIGAATSAWIPASTPKGTNSLTVGRARWCRAMSATDRRIRSAVAAASWWSPSGRSRRNSSPPQRYTLSSWRTLRCRHLGGGPGGVFRRWRGAGSGRCRA